MTTKPICTCASFFTVRGVHKKDCPAYTIESWEESIDGFVLGEYSVEVAEATRSHIKSIIREAVARAVSEERERVVGMMAGMMQKKPEGKCINAENHLFGSCFACKTIDGYNTALTDLISKLRVDNPPASE